MSKKLMLKNDSGFTLIEIMVVVGVTITILALGLPSMLRSRMNANESAAISNCRLISNVCQSYYTNALPHTYPPSFDYLILPISDPPYINTELASGSKQGYAFSFTFISSESFTLNANPSAPGRTGTRYFFVDETGVIRVNSEGPAGPNDEPVAG